MSKTNLGEAQAVLVNIDGRRLEAKCLGEGGPLVLLEVGVGMESPSWMAVAEGVARLTRVCFYDRAGRRGSDPAPKPRGPEDLVNDVHRLVHALGGEGPCIIAGQSLGGLIARLYAHRYPKEVAGLVLVDSMHEDQFETCAPLFPPHQAGEPPILTGMRSFWSGGWRDPSKTSEGIDMLACQAAAHRITSLGNIPIRVLVAKGFTYGATQLYPPEEGKKIQKAWEGLQAQFTQLSTDVRHEIIEDSGHFMQVDKPSVVVDAIAGLLKDVRQARSARH